MSDSNGNEISSKKRFFLPIVLPAILAIITPGAYLLGTNFDQGYIEAFGISSDQFHLSTPDVYIISYYAVGYFLLFFGKHASLIVEYLLSKDSFFYIILSVLLNIEGAILLERFKHLFHKEKIKKHLDDSKKYFEDFLRNNKILLSFVSCITTAYSFVLFISATTVLIALFWWSLPLSARTKGEELATEQISHFLKSGCQSHKKTKWDSCVVILDKQGKTLHEGLLIGLNDKEIAMFKKDGSYIFARQNDWVIHKKSHKVP
ncbi:MAG: hypothetical protein SD837_13340 [Candidatus Electrothrix scaldis]|nr:MAG: hypothetical protein SD837_13340 [Candidatus Electrothrix sp. GW3-3]